MKKKRKIKLIPIIVLLVIICVMLFGLCLKDLYDVLKKKSIQEIKVLETIEKYDYKLNENETDYTKKLFKSLKEEIEKEDMNEKEYASIMSQVFLSDFYSLKATVNKNDVGGTQFIYKDYQTDFIKGAKDSIYGYVENNIYGNRKQELPIVKEISITSIKTVEYDYLKKTDEKAYEVTASITYDKDLDYPKEVTLIIIHSNDKLEIAEMKN